MAFNRVSPMFKSRKLFIIIPVLLLLFALGAGASSNNRYLVKSNSGFWKNTFGARHEFSNGFSADLSDWQLRIAKVFGLELEPVMQLEILPDEAETEDVQEQEDASAKPENPGNGNGKGGNKGGGDSDRPVPSDQTPWGVEYVYDDAEIAVTSGGEGVNIAVLDTGVNKDHPDLQRRVQQCKDFTHARRPITDGKCDDKNGHGTHVAGVAVADGGSDGLGVFGLAPEANLWAYKVCGVNGSCWADDISAAIREASDQGAHIINMSLGSDVAVPMINDAINYAQEKGVLVVVAAGNDGPDFGSIDYPAALEYSVSVAAFDQDLEVPDWSSRGINSDTTEFIKEAGDIEFTAPGVGIESTWKDGSYAVLSGTSMATPHITGLAAKLWQFDDEDPAGATRLLLQSLAVDYWDPGVDNDATGFGAPAMPLIP